MEKKNCRFNKKWWTSNTSVSLKSQTRYDMTVPLLLPKTVQYLTVTYGVGHYLGSSNIVFFVFFFHYIWQWHMLCEDFLSGFQYEFGFFFFFSCFWRSHNSKWNRIPEKENDRKENYHCFLGIRNSDQANLWKTVSFWPSTHFTFCLERNMIYEFLKLCLERNINTLNNNNE